MYIVIEGQDGTGKSTQARLIAEHFEKQGREVVVMDEPDGDLPGAHDLHDLILVRGRDYGFDGLTNVLLFTAARVELWRKVAEPVLRRGGIVVSARNWWSTLAYQGYGEGISRSRISRLTHECLPARYVKPDFGVILKVSDKVRLKRQGGRGKAAETFEAKPDEFQARVNAGYLAVAKDFDVPVLDASGTIEEVFNSIHRLMRD